MSNLLYDALMLGRNKKVAAEEYQVATGRKKSASFHVTEEYISISNVISDGEFCVHLFQDVPGYMEIEVFCSDNFLIFDRKVLSSEEFQNGTYEFKFMVISDRLHNGRNYTSICFRTSSQDLQVPVVIDNKIRVNISDTNPRERYISLSEKLLALKMGQLELPEWIRENEDLLNEIPGEDVDSLFLMLYKAQVFITAGDDIHARNYIEHVGTQIPKLEQKNYDIYCYFIYLASLYEELPGVLNSALQDLPLPDTFVRGNRQGFRQSAPSDIMDMSALQKVRWVYSHNPSWWILWILFYMDPEYQNDPGLRLKEMQDMFYDRGCISPYLYLESLKILYAFPNAIKEPGSFEIHTLYYAVRYGELPAEPAEKFARLLLEEKGSRLTLPEIKLAVKILKAAYKRYHGRKILSALCRMLIAAEMKDPSDHPYFRKAVLDGNDDEEIFNYYIYTLDQSQMEPVDPKVMKYFLEHTELLYEYKAYMYANIITNKYQDPASYQESRNAFVRFAEYQMAQRQNDELLAVIYREILDNGLLTQPMKENLFDVISTKEILCANDRMVSVLVFHDELQVYQESILRQGKAAVKIYSPEALILFKDATGNLYHNVEYSVNHLVESREYIDLCIKDVQINHYMLLGDTFPILRAYKPALDILEYFTSHKMAGQFRKGYERELLTKVVSYYVKNTRDEKVYDELLKFIEFDLSSETRGQLIGIMLERDLIDEAYEQVREYGPCGLSAQELSRLAHGYVERHGLEEDQLLTYLCETGFNAEGFDEDIFEYLYRYYDGRMDLLIELFRSCNAYHRDASVIEERILRRSISTGEHPEVVSLIFRRYYNDGEDRALIRKYLEYRAGLYMYRLMTVSAEEGAAEDTGFFDYIEKDLMRGLSFSDDCMAAYLLYRTGAEELEERQIRTIEKVLKDLVRRGKMLEEFKWFRKYFELPSTLANNIIISAFSEDGAETPMIAYEMTGSGRTVSGAEEMEEIFRRCYVKYFTLFYGEKVVFSMDGKENTEVRYSDLSISRDGSRYAALDDIIRLKETKDSEGFKQAVREFYIREKLIERLL